MQHKSKFKQPRNCLLGRECNDVFGGVSSEQCGASAAKRLPRSLKPAQLERAVPFLKCGEVDWKKGFRKELSWRAQGEKTGKHVQALISRDDCILGGAWRDNVCLKKRKVRGGKGEGCGQNKMSYKEWRNETWSVKVVLVKLWIRREKKHTHKKKHIKPRERIWTEHDWGLKKREILQRSCSSPPTLNTFCITDQFSSILFWTGSVFCSF